MDRLFQDIFDKMTSYLPTDWGKVALMANYGDGSYSIYIHVKINNQYTEISDLGYTEKDIHVLKREIHKLIKSERKQLTGKDLWYTMTLIVDGNFKADFDYEDVSENSIEYTLEWRKKYLV